MYQCEHCGKSIQKQNICPNCGTTVYSAIGKIICGPTAKDMSCCSITVTDKYIIVSRMSKGEVRAKKYSAGVGGLLGYFLVDAALSKQRNCGYYPLSNIAKGISPYLATGIKKKNCIKIINKDGSDFILMVDMPSFSDSVWKAFKKTVAAIQQRIPLVEDGNGKNFGSVICAKPYVTLENFDRVKPGYTPTANQTYTAQKTQSQAAPKTAPAKAVNDPVIVTPPPAVTTISGRKCNHCGANVAEESKFCNQCGGKIETPQIRKKNCLRCGEPLDATDKFCSNCGYQAK